jgi:hypothetical protein
LNDFATRGESLLTLLPLKNPNDKTGGSSQTFKEEQTRDRYEENHEMLFCASMNQQRNNLARASQLGVRRHCAA